MKIPEKKTKQTKKKKKQKQKILQVNITYDIVYIKYAII